MTLTLEHRSNPDIPGYWSGMPPGPKTQKIEVSDFLDAKIKFRKWIDDNDLGGGNMTRKTGEIHEGKTLVAQFSYGGRLRNPAGKEIPVESSQTEETSPLQGCLSLI